MKIIDLIDVRTKNVKTEFVDSENFRTIDCDKLTEDIDDLEFVELKHEVSIRHLISGGLGAVDILSFSLLSDELHFINFFTILNNSKKFPKASKCFSIAYMQKYFKIYKQCNEIYKTLTNEEKLKLELELYS